MTGRLLKHQYLGNDGKGKINDKIYGAHDMCGTSTVPGGEENYRDDLPRSRGLSSQGPRELTRPVLRSQRRRATQTGMDDVFQ